MVDWSLIGQQHPLDVFSSFKSGYAVGKGLKGQRDQDSALSALSGNPSDNNALAKLYQVNPQLGEHFQKRGQDLQETQRRVEIGQQYARGDTQGARAAAVGAGDFDLAGELGKLDEATQKRAVGFWEKAGPIAYRLKQISDPAQRQALWAQAKQILQSEADPAQLDKFDPTNDTQLDAAITTSQKIGDLVSQGKIEWHQQGENPSFATDAMGHPVGSANPAAITAGSHPPQSAVDYLKAHPDLASHFDEKYGAGASASILGGATGNPSPHFPVSNNPGALRVPGSMKFQSFSTPQEGIHAQQALLGRYMGRGLNNVSSIVETYAPRQSHGGDNSDASVNNYIAYVAKRLNVNPHDALSPALLSRLSEAMREFETGQRVQ